MRVICPFVILAACCATAVAQPVQPPQDTLDAVRQMTADARREIQAYDATPAGEHPAIKWDRALWQVHERAAGTDAAGTAAVEAIRLLTQAQLWQQADARIDSLGMDDAAWERLPSVIYEAGITRKDLPAVITRLSRVAESTTNRSARAAAWIIVGRANRRQGDLAAAARAMEAAKAAAPNTRYAEEARGLLYEIAHLSPGMPAPAIAAKARNAGTISLAALHGKPVVLVFWGTT